MEITSYSAANAVQDMYSPFVEMYYYGSIVLIFLGLVSNAIIIMVMLKRNKFVFSTNVYFASLAIFDNLYLIIALIEGIVSIAGGVDHLQVLLNTISKLGFNDISCKIAYIASYGLPCTSIYILTAQTIDRCHVVLNPYKPKPTRKHAIICISIIFVSEIVFFMIGSRLVGFGYAESVPNVTYHGLTAHDKHRGKACNLQDDNSTFAIGYLLLDMIFNGIIPLLIVIIANSILVISLKKHENQMSSFGSQSAARKERRITLKIIAGNVFYVICILPGTVYFTIVSVLPEVKGAAHDITEKLILSAIFLYVANFSLKFYVYFLSSSDFRKEVKNVFLHAKKVESPAQTTLTDRGKSTEKL